MSVDREHRDKARSLLCCGTGCELDVDTVASLLADLEQAERERDAFAEVNVEREAARQQAERERDEARKWANTMEHERDWEQQVVHSELLQRAQDAEARLAAVPALVEALRKSCAELDDTVAACDEDNEPYPDTMVEVSAILRGALAAYEQAQGETP